MISLGIDVGGTFTDFVAYNHGDGNYKVYKVLSTPSNIILAIIKGIKEMGINSNEIKIFAHGTTVSTNTIIEKKGAKTALLTTKGFRDLLQFRRTNRDDVYNLQWDPPSELIPRNLRFEIDERTDAEGNILKEVNKVEVEVKLKHLIKTGVESIAVVFLHSYLNPQNEQVIKKIIQNKYPEIKVCVSSDILREWREFERTSTCVVNAYLAPVLNNYLEKLEKEMKKEGYTRKIFVMLSNGGLSTSQVARELPAYTLASGPAGGVIAEREICLNSFNERNIVGLDIGGTSADVSLIRDGKPTLIPEQEVKFGLPVRLPAIEVISIGAGGGSIAWIDQGNGLHVGPQSAGAQPGPACYGKGGEEPTVTDANMVLGRLNPEYLLKGEIPVSLDKSRSSLLNKICKPLQLKLEKAAWGILEIVNNKMANAIREVTIQRGIDPREFVLFAYGGAGPMHAAHIAQELSISRVIIPPHPGVNSALGLLMADIRHDFCETFLKRLNDIKISELNIEFERIEESGRSRLIKEGLQEEDILLVRNLDLRYSGQTHELTVEIPWDGREDMKTRIINVFKKYHLENFGFIREEKYPIEIVNLRLIAIGLLSKINIDKKIADRSEIWHENSARPVVFDKDCNFVKTPIFDKDDIPIGKPYRGPAIIEQFDSTIVVFPGQNVWLDSIGNIVIEGGVNLC